MATVRRSSPGLVAAVLGSAVAALLFAHNAFVPTGSRLQIAAPSLKPWGFRGAPIARKSAIDGVAAGPTRVVAGPTDVVMVRSPAESYMALAEKGAENSQKPIMKIFHQSFVSGCYVGFAGLLSLSIAGNIGPAAAAAPGLQKMVFGALFPVNLLLILISGGQLFTHNTATVPMAVLEGKATMGDLARSWTVSILGNILGCGALAAAALYAGFLVGGTKQLAITTTMAKTSMSFGQAFVKAVMCNWMVCMAVFLSEAARDLGGKMVGIWFPISAFVAMSMEHSVANMFLIPAGIMVGANVSVAQMILKNWIPVCLGNAFAGVVCVAISYSYAFGKLGQ